MLTPSKAEQDAAGSTSAEVAAAHEALNNYELLESARQQQSQAAHLGVTQPTTAENNEDY